MNKGNGAFRRDDLSQQPYQFRNTERHSESVSEYLAAVGSLPTPDLLFKYSRVIPNGAERIMRIAENEQSHRMNIETKMVNGTIWTARLGQIFGLTIGLAVLILGFVCIIEGHDISGTAMSGLGVTGLVSVFVLGRKRGEQG